MFFFVLLNIILFLVQNELQTKYPELSISQPFVSMDFGDGQLSSLMTSGRLFDVHKNLPSKGIQNIIEKKKSSTILFFYF